jgi:hypothetical protein
MEAAAGLARPLPRFAMIRARREDTRVISLRTKALIGIALIAFLAGI